LSQPAYLKKNFTHKKSENRGKQNQVRELQRDLRRLYQARILKSLWKV